MQSNNNQLGTPTNNDAKMNSMQDYQQQETRHPESFADKIAKLRQHPLNQAIAPNSQFTNEQEDPLNSFNTHQQPQPQETKTLQNIEEKLAQLQQQSIVPRLIEEKVKPPLEKAGNIISMLPVPYP